jgi:hypothetical protein
MRFNVQLLVLPMLAGIFMLSQGCGEPAGPKVAPEATLKSTEKPDWYKGPGSVNPASLVNPANKAPDKSADKAK